MKKLFTILFVCFAVFAFAQEQDPGTADLTFGTDGTYRFETVDQLEDLLESVLVQEDGKILTVGRSRTDGSNYAIYVTRHNVDGTLDETYGEGGISHFKVNPTIYMNGAKDAALSEDGLLYITGWTFDYENNTAFIICLDENGFEYPEFGEEGVMQTPKGAGVVYEAIDVDSEGNVVVVGYYNDLLLVRRYLPDGQLDTSFGKDGSVNDTVPGSVWSYAYDVEILEDGKIVLAGTKMDVWQDEFVIHKSYVCRLNADGSFDNTFGGNGVVSLGVGEYAEMGLGIEVDAEGNYLVTGHDELPSINPESQLPRYESYITRITKDGVIDTSFGEDGDGFVRFEAFEGDGCVNNQDAPCIVAPDGQIFGSFYSWNHNDLSSRAYVYNLDADGKFKENFVGGGIVSVPVIFEELDLEIRTMSLALQDNKLLVGGYIYYDNHNDYKAASDLYISRIVTDLEPTNNGDDNNGDDNNDDNNGTDTTAVAEIDYDALRIYPNPASSELYVKSAKNAQVSIIDLTGRCVKEIEATDELTTINISDIESGVYFIMIQDERNRFVEKLVVK